MRLTRRSTVLLGVFFIGLIALVADRTILRPQGGLQAASAASEAGGPGLLAGNLPILEDQPRAEGVAERLSGLWTGQEPVFEQMRNPFALPATWLGTENTAGGVVPDEVARFIRTHQLTAVVVNGAESYVFADDRFLVPGQILDGFTLVSVAERSAVFESEAGQAILELVGR
jgi:hypothetical protein